jgi:hypothetical protein
VTLDEPGMNVRVGAHIPPAGGPHIAIMLKSILAEVNTGTMSPYRAHLAYETLHPFMDGNGRSGRAVWLWQMQRDTPYSSLALGFLHRFYYQTLGEAR